MRRFTPLSTALKIAGVAILTSQAYLIAQEPSVPSDTPERETAAEPKGQTDDISRGALAEWLTVQLSQAQSVSQFASHQTQSQQVRDLARKTALAYTNLAREIEGAAPQVPTETDRSVAGGSDISEGLEEVAETIREEAAKAPQEQREAPAVVRREARRPLREPTRQEPAAQATETETQATEGEDDEDTRRLLQRENGILARLRNAAAERNADRGTARERLQRILPVLRASLPEVVDVVTEAIEEGAQPATIAWLELQREHSQGYAQNVQEELSQYRGQAFDQAYLGYELLTNLRLTSALEVVQQRAGPELRPVLDEGLQTLNSLSRQSRQLMEGAQSNGPNQP